MRTKKIGIIVLATAAVGLAVLGGATLASAAPGDSSPAPTGSAAPGGPGGSHGRHDHTPVTGDEAAKVTAAVKAKDSAVTVTTVRKDPDGSYDVLGTRAGSPVMLEVSADLKTITERAGRGGGPGRRPGTPVTGDEAAKVTAAVRAKDSAVTVTDVHKSPDGSYHVHGTRNGDRVGFEVSPDLKTVTERAGRPEQGGRGGRGGHGPGGRHPGGNTTNPAPGSSAPGSSAPGSSAPGSPAPGN